MLHIELGILLRKISERRKWVQSVYRRECHAEIAQDAMINKYYYEAERLIKRYSHQNYIDLNGEVHKRHQRAVDNFQKK